VVAVSPAFVSIDRQARMYSLEGLFTVVAWWLTWLSIARTREWSTVRKAICYCALAVAVAGEVWTMALGIPTAGLQFVTAVGLAVWLARRERTMALASLWAAAAVVMGSLTLIPWLPNLLGVANGPQPFWTPRPGIASLPDTAGTWLIGSDAWIPAGIVAAAGLVVGAVGIAALLLAREAAPAEDPRAPISPAALAGLIVAAGLALVPVVWLYSQFRSVYDSRYFAGLVPLFAVAVGAGAVAIARQLKRRGPGRGLRWLGRPGLALTLVAAPLAVAMLAISFGDIQTARSDDQVDPARQTASALSERVHEGDVILTINAQSYFPLRYYLERTGWLREHGVRLLDWHTPGNAYFTGWQDIEPSSLVEPSAVARTGWRSALGLGPTGTIWLTTLVDPSIEFAKFEPLKTGALRVTGSVEIGAGDLSARICGAAPGS